MARFHDGPIIEKVEASAYAIATDSPESDGTLAWEKTTLVLVEVLADGTAGIGYTYADAAVARLVNARLNQVVEGRDPMAVEEVWLAMRREVRNHGYCGLSAMGISAVDLALWDLKARLLDVSVATLLGRVRPRVSVYGSGGFTSYSIPELEGQLAGWVAQGISRVKMKVGRAPEEDPDRVAAARSAIGPSCELFVDANGAYGRKEALAMASLFADVGVSWFEEPVSSDDLEGLRLVRDRSPAGMDIAAGEYGFHSNYFRRMLAAGAVDVLQADVTRCGGFTGFAKVAALCEAFGLPLSTHCAPALSLFAACSAQPVRHLEWFHDHARIEQMLFDGTPQPFGGALEPNLARAGLGLVFKRQDAARFAL
ncbi:MAG TPA: mandelate racemase [Myxococcales bacterium]|jgi:L-alanine-DL-glutamate epimerase-like enolase superfamily enzyme|nr:mandelate racemase [Myxococcales bacterium]